MPDKITTKQAFFDTMKEGLPELLRTNPQFVLDALVQNKDAMTESLRKLGIFASPAVADPAEVIRQYREAQTQGRILTGFGARYREAVAHLGREVFDQKIGRKRISYIARGGELEKMTFQWMRAMLSPDYHDPESGMSIRELTDKLNVAVRAPSTPLTADAGSGGSHLVPLVVVAEIFEEMTERFVLQGLVQSFTSAAPLKIPRRVALPSVTRTGASTDITEQNMDATLGSVTLSPERAAAIAYIDPLVAMAAAVGPVQYVIGQFAEAIARDNQRVIVAGSPDLREPRGISTLPTAGGNVYDRIKTATWLATNNGTKRQSFRKAMYAISQFHRSQPSFRWMSNSDAIVMFSGLNDTDQQPFRDATATAPETFFGKEIVETTALVSAGNQTTVIGGDLNQYAWLESPDGLRMEQTPIGGQAWVSDTVGVKAVQRVDGAPIIPPAFTLVASVDV